MDVAIGIIQLGKKILIARRPFHKSHGGYWEFPGGKIEKDETPFQALQRELFEEIGVEVRAAQFLSKTHYSYPDKQVRLHFFLVTEYSGKPYSKEGQMIYWALLASLHQFRFPKGNQAIIRWLRCNNHNNQWVGTLKFGKKCALDNPDLPIKFVKDILISKHQDRLLAEPFKFEKKSDGH